MWYTHRVRIGKQKDRKLMATLQERELTDRVKGRFLALFPESEHACLSNLIDQLILAARAEENMIHLATIHSAESLDEAQLLARTHAMLTVPCNTTTQLWSEGS